MAVRWIWRAVVLMGLIAVMAAIAPPEAQAQDSDDLDAINRRVVQLSQAGKYAEAMEIAKQSLGLAEKRFGPEHPEVATSLNNLAELYRVKGRAADAEPLYKRSLAIREKALGPNHPQVATSLNNLAALYGTQGRYAEAEQLLKRALVLREKALGPDHPDVALSLNNLATLYHSQGRYDEAEPLFKRSLAIAEKALGPDHPQVATSLNSLAALYDSRGRYAEAEPLYKHSAAIYEKALGPGHPDVAMSLNNLAALYRTQGRTADAEPLYKRSLAIVEKALGADHPNVGIALSNLALLYEDQGRTAEAEPLHKRSLAIAEKALGPNHPQVATSLNNLAALYRTEGRYAEAEPLYKRALAISENAFGPEHPQVAISLSNLALLYDTQGRTAEAEALYKRSLAIREKALGRDHPDVANSLNNLAALYGTRGRTAEAEPLYKRSLAIAEKALGPGHPQVATSLNNLAALYKAQGRIAEAEALYKRSLAIREKALGADHPDVAQSLNNLAELYKDQGLTAEAEPLYKRSLAIYETALGPDHPNVVQLLNNLAVLNLAQRDWARAAEYWRRGTTIIVRRAQRGTVGGPESLTARGESEAQRLRYQFFGLVKAAYRLATSEQNRHASEAREMFQTAQWALVSEAAISLAQMATRSAKGVPALATLVRERQDLVSEWQRRDGVRTAAMSQPRGKRNKDDEAANAARLEGIDKRIGEIDTTLKDKFPDYAALVSLAPLSVADVQALLTPDEALVLFLDTPEWKPTPEETFIWIVAKNEMRWVRSELGTSSLKREVAALRCGLDYYGTWGAPGARCSELLKTNYTETDHKGGKPLPFDREHAYALYNALFGQIEDVIRDKQLLIVPSGALTQLPFQVLVTQKPDTASGDDAFRRAAWLVRKHALTVVPSVSSLKALRQLAKDSHANRAMIGFGNPLLDGPDWRYQTWAKDARAKQSCPAAPEQRVADLTGERGGVLPFDLRRGLADVTQVRLQVPLPETADELCTVARDLRVSSDDIRLGARATEAEIKRLSDAGELSKYRVIHFATHGALAGQVSGNSEPGLLLTPPEKATETDDGYLSASEIAALKLDADWVILSACNTAAGNAEGAEALSGLARAFFYAGARALLVSHWAVASDPTVKLITGAVKRMASDKRIGRAEAMRQSMLALIDKGEPYEAHPAFWAPFIVVGEGGTGR